MSPQPTPPPPLHFTYLSHPARPNTPLHNPDHPRIATTHIKRQLISSGNSSSGDNLYQIKKAATRKQGKNINICNYSPEYCNEQNSKFRSKFRLLLFVCRRKDFLSSPDTVFSGLSSNIQLTRLKSLFIMSEDPQIPTSCDVRFFCFIPQYVFQKFNFLINNFNISTG